MSLESRHPVSCSGACFLPLPRAPLPPPWGRSAGIHIGADGDAGCLHTDTAFGKDRQGPAVLDEQQLPSPECAPRRGLGGLAPCPQPSGTSLEEPRGGGDHGPEKAGAPWRAVLRPGSHHRGAGVWGGGDHLVVGSSLVGGAPRLLASRLGHPAFGGRVHVEVGGWRATPWPTWLAHARRASREGPQVTRHGLLPALDTWAPSPRPSTC